MRASFCKILHWLKEEMNPIECERVCMALYHCAVQFLASFSAVTYFQLSGDLTII